MRLEEYTESMQQQKKCADLLRKKKCICSPKRSHRRTIRYACNFSAKKYAQKESEIMIIETNSEKETFELGKKSVKMQRQVRSIH